jgi:hypothetical protein
MIPNTTQMKPDFLSKKLKMPYHLRRFDKHDSRFYFEVEDRRSTQGKEVIIPYISITSLADKLIPGGKQIDMWRASLGKEAEKVYDGTGRIWYLVPLFSLPSIDR